MHEVWGLDPNTTHTQVRETVSSCKEGAASNLVSETQSHSEELCRPTTHSGAEQYSLCRLQWSVFRYLVSRIKGLVGDSDIR